MSKVNLNCKKMSKPILYYLPASAPCRSVIAIARMLNVDMEMKLVDLLNKEHLKPEFIKLNPFHKIPTFVDSDGFVLDESRAICMYLIQSRKPDSPLYPSSNLKKRAHIDRWIQYDVGLYMTIGAPVYACLHGRQVDEFLLNQAKDTLKTLDEVMGLFSGKFLTGCDQMTVADVSMYFTCSLLEVGKDFYDINHYPNIKAWYHRVDEALKPYDPDGMFPKANEMMKKYLDEHSKKQ